MDNGIPKTVSLTNTYKIEENIGKGGMADVYKAIDLKNEKEVAIKFIQESRINSKSLEFFRQEALVAAAINHPSIVNTYGIGYLEDGRPFIVMEYLKGKTLREILNRDEKLDSSTAAYIVAQALSAMDEVHTFVASDNEMGHAVHRDLKPENIFLVETGQTPNPVKVLDFGILHITNFKNLRSNVSDSGERPGTISYMAPEQLNGDKINERTDIYSLGVILYECLAGKLPFTATEYLALSAEISGKKYYDLNLLGTNVSKELEEIVYKAIEPDPQDRFKNAAEMLSKLLPHMDDAQRSMVPTPRTKKPEIQVTFTLETHKDAKVSLDGKKARHIFYDEDAKHIFKVKRSSKLHKVEVTQRKRILWQKSISAEKNRIITVHLPIQWRYRIEVWIAFALGILFCVSFFVNLAQVLRSGGNNDQDLNGEVGISSNDASPKQHDSGSDTGIRNINEKADGTIGLTESKGGVALKRDADMDDRQDKQYRGGGDRRWRNGLIKRHDISDGSLREVSDGILSEAGVKQSPDSGQGEGVLDDASTMLKAEIESGNFNRGKTGPNGAMEQDSGPSKPFSDPFFRGDASYNRR